MSGHRAGRKRAGWVALGLATSLALLFLGGCGLLRDEEPEAVPTNTPRAVVRVIPTWTPIMTATPEPTATPDVVDVSGCTLGAVYVRDVTIPDGTRLDPGEQFVKTWEIRNTGSCAWDRGYWLVFVDNEQMGAEGRVAVPATPAGATAQVSVTFTAPAVPGEYRSDWQMQVNDERFGSNFYTVVVVEG